MRVIVAFLLGATGLVAEPTLPERLLQAVPKAKEGEFSTAESVVREFYESVIEGDLNRSVKCFPVHGQFAAASFEAELEMLGLYTPRQTAPPGDRLSRLYHALAAHGKAVADVRLGLKILLDPGVRELLELTRIRTGPGEIDREKVALLKKRLDVSSLRGVKILAIVEGPRNDSKRAGILPVTHRQLMTVRMGHGGRKLEHTVAVAKHGGNFQIMAVLSEFSP